MISDNKTVRTIAVVSYHSSPLTEPGSGDAGGMTVYVRELADALAKRGIATDIFTRATRDAPHPVRLQPGVRVVPIAAGPDAAPKEDLPRFITEFADGVAAFATAQRVSYDVVHSHYWQSGIAARVLASRWRIPLVHSSHTLAKVKNRFLAPGDQPEPLHRISGESQVLNASDVLVASTVEERDQLKGLYGIAQDRIKTIYPGVDHDLFVPSGGTARRDLGLENSAVLLFVGRIQPLKGVELAIRAVDQLVSALDRDIQLLVVGGASGPEGDTEVDRLRRITNELGLEDHVRFLGPRKRADLPRLYRSADAVVVCSHSESFGFAALEAHACGTPVVATAVGGLAHVVADGRSGFLVDTRDPAEFAARLKTLLSDHDLRRSFASEAIKSSTRFAWDATADSMLELYECLTRVDEPEACTC